MVGGRERERGQVMIYDHDAAFQHRMINLFWEHFTSTSLTYLGLAHACTHTRQCAHKNTSVSVFMLCMPYKQDINEGPECM